MILVLWVQFLVWIHTVHPDENVTQMQNHQNVTVSQNVSTLHRFYELAGIRVFSQKQEAELRIVGGLEAWAQSWPWQVSLQYIRVSVCGGAIIAPMWIISAAHCFRRHTKASLWKVLAGKHDLENPQEHGQQLVGVSMIISHSSFNIRTKDFDVALLKLQAPLEFNQFVRPIQIWTTPLPVSRMCTVTGWGSTRENGPRVHRLHEVNVTLLPLDVCKQYYTRRMRSSMFCAGKESGGTDACQGDSGGPLSCFTGSRYELAGLVSWGVGCGRARKPGVYTKLQLHIQWISDTINNQNLINTEVETEDDACGWQQNSSCDLVPGPAGLLVTQTGRVLLDNVTESCPFFWPWQVSLQSNQNHYCSGTLVHRRWVLTAAHCHARAKEDTVTVGVHDLKFWAPQMIRVDEVFDLPKDNSFPPKHDLSLLRLSVPVRLSSIVSPICVPDEDEELDNTWTCFTAGWGNVSTTADVSSDRLHHARLALVNRTTCNEKWGRGLIRDSHICVHPAGSASCMGDAGAPLFCRKRETFFLFGVVTWGSSQCDGSKPAVYSSIPDFHSWITNVTDDL